MQIEYYAIDFGTSNSLICGISSLGPEAPLAIDASNSDPTILRSVMFAANSGTWFYGEEAISQYTADAAEGRLLRSIKKYLPDNGFEGTNILSKRWTLSDLIGKFLRLMKEKADSHYGCDVKKVVLGRPAAFSLDLKKDKLAEDRMRLAAKVAGFDEVHFCPEPIAAAFAFRKELTEEKTVLIADFGGGTSDYTIVKLGPKAFRFEDVLGIGGIPIAGDRFDGSIMKHMIAPHFGSQIKYRIPMGSNDLELPKHLINKLCSAPDISFLARKDIMSLLRDAQKWSLSDENAHCMERLFVLVEEHLGYKLFREIEKTKRGLSDSEEALFDFDHPEIEIEERISRSDFRSHSFDIADQILKSLDLTLAKAQLDPSSIDIVCCTGGTAQIPALHHGLAERFGAEKLQAHQHFHSVIGGLGERAFSLLQDS